MSFVNHTLSTALILSLTSVGYTSPATTSPSTQPSVEERTQPDRALTIDEAIKQTEIDPRLSLCHVWLSKDGSLRGFAEHPQLRDAIARMTRLDGAGIKLLPEQSKTSERFGIMKQDAILRDLPDDQPGDRDNLTQLLQGEPVWILDQAANGAFIVHGIDGYIGWVDSASVQTVGGPAMKAAINRHRTADADRRSQKLLDAAQTYIGTTYLWGGKSRAGIDCSGLVQMSFEQVNVLLPRDADQQANVGRLVATRWFRETMLPGDLLFFISPRRGNVHHVAIHIGEGRYIEAADEGVRVLSLDPASPEFDAARAATFAFARRVIE